LAQKGIELAWKAIEYGTTTLEMKSGYGLSIESEIALLKAIDIVKRRSANPHSHHIHGGS
jgi:imidazolonepropionase-like amidohydrolase